jgi:hypothetical protein
MDSDGGQATLSCHRAPCGWVSLHERVKEIIAREGLRRRGSTVLRGPYAHVH